MVRNAPSVESVMEELHRKIGNVPLIAHNASFDKKFLDTELERIGRTRRQDFICSMRVARRVLRSASNYKLATLVEHVGLTLPSNAHRALADAEMTARLWTAMEQTLQRKFGLQDIPLSLFEHLQSVTIAKADGYIRNYARANNRYQSAAPGRGQAKASQEAPVSKGHGRTTKSRPILPADLPYSAETVKCITCGHAISVVEIDGILWLKCPCCGFNTRQRHCG